MFYVIIIGDELSIMMLLAIITVAYLINVVYGIWIMM